jgi:hypothetical protein
MAAAEVVHGEPFRFSDPARFSLAHGGKDGHPFPVPLKVYDETIRVLKNAISNAKLGRSETLAAIKRLDQRARALEHVAEGPTFAEIMADERRLSSSYGGRTVARRWNLIVCGRPPASYSILTKRMSERPVTPYTSPALPR